MKVKTVPIPTDSLINEFLPSDYSDAFTCETESIALPSPDDIMISFFTDMPGWVNALFKLRNFLVRFVGLKGDANRWKAALEDCIHTGGGQYDFSSIPAKNEKETVLLLTDKHLDAYVSVHLATNPDNRKTNITLITVVHFNNKLGNIYFFFIRPFHKIIVKSMLKRLVARIQ